MPKRIKKTTPACDEHLFSLKPKHNFCRFAQTVSVSFCDPSNDKNKNKNKKCRNCDHLDCPVFNHDLNFATPTFILNSEKQYYEQRGIKLREEHERKMVEYTDEKDSLNIPKPRTRNNFCSVCRQVYEDYLDHIKSQKHKKKINSSIFNKYILDVAEKFKPNPNSKNILNYSYPTLSTRDEEDLELLENKPIKKVKSDQELHERQQTLQDYTRTQIAPPPHLNLNNSAYFPGLASSINYFSNPINPFSFSQLCPQMAFNYNMNFYWNPYCNPQSYGMMDSWINYFPMTQANPSTAPRIEQNYFLQGKTAQKLQQNFNEPRNYNFNSLEKKELNLSKQEIIVIDDDQCGFDEKPEHKF